MVLTAYCLLALAAGAMTTVAFPPTGVWLMALVGPAVGFSAFALAGDARRGALTGLAWGVGFSFVLFRWTLELHPAAYVALAGVQSVFWLLPGAVGGHLASRSTPGRWVTACAAAWTVSEVLRSRLPFGGFEWGQLGLATAQTPLRVGAATIGALGLTGLAAAAAAALALLVVGRTSRTTVPRADWRPLLVTALVGALVVAVGFAPWTRSVGELDVGIVQVDDPCPGVFAADCPNLRARLVAALVDGTATLSGGQELTLWGEGILSGPTLEEAGDQLVASTGVLPAPLFTGADTPAGPDRFVRWNALYTPAGGLLGAYAKRQPVPFGEFVPLRSLLGGIGDVGRLVGRDMVPGPGPRLVTLPTEDGPVHIGSVVSWEVTFGRLMRDSARGAELLATLTTQASYGTTSVSDQLLGAAQLRAAEAAKPLVVAATTGRSAIIAPDGARLATTALFQADTLEGTVGLRSGQTPFTRWGQAPVTIVAVLGLVVMLRTPARPRRPAAGRGRRAQRRSSSVPS